ncbi:MAG TPA: tripartite tricarboxylate transporter permease [Tepidanaerobacter syntrophicus]|nr:tripartite tricarboxylate transporter permease [Tepidanaerobacter syntrophicus]
MELSGTFSYLISGFATVLSGMNLLYCAIGVIFGMLVGVLPGLGPTAGTAILLPMTFGMTPAESIIMLAGIYYGAMYGGTITSVLINTPGETASVITCLDGYPLARQGRAGAALGVAAIGSFIGGMIALLGLLLVGPVLANQALKFGPPEFFCLILMGLSLVISLLGKSVVKGLIAALLGLMLSLVGVDPFNGTIRFAFGQPNLISGINFIAVSMGIFALTEIFANLAEDLTVKKEIPKIQSMFPYKDEWPIVLKSIFRGSFIGFFMGLIPGCGSSIPTVISYSVEKKLSKHPEKFGTGVIEGVAAPETANNAFCGGALIPMFTLGIPTSPAMAMLMGAFIMHGVAPGPTLFSEHPEVVWPVIASMFIGNLLLVVMNLPLANVWAQITKVPNKYLFPSIIIVSILGVYSINYNLFDVWVMVIAGLIAYFMKMADFPMVPLILTFILGDNLELALDQSMTMFRGDMTQIFHRPICVVLITIIVGALFIGIIGKAKIKEKLGDKESEI